MIRLLISYLLPIVLCSSVVHAESLVNGGAVTGELTSDGEIKVYTFLAETDQYVHINIVATTGIVFDILSPSGRVIKADHQLTSSKFVGVSAPETGIYQLKIRGFYNEARGTFTIHYAKPPGVDEFGELGGAPTFGEFGNGNIDSYTITLQQGDIFYLYLGERNPGYVFLCDPDGALLGGNQMGFNLVAEKSGRYTVLATSKSVNPQSYVLHLAKVPGSNELGLLESLGSRDETITSQDLDTYTFKGKIGASANLVFDATIPIQVFVYSPSATLIGQRLVWSSSSINISSLPEDGIYTVVIRAYYAWSSGDYSFSFTLPNIGTSYAALGDSYSSGEGVLPFVGDFGIFSACNRSYLAYSGQVRSPLSSLPLSLDPNAKYDFYACTGAVTNNISAGGEGQYGELPQLEASKSQERDLITLTISGNDAFFAWILGYCLAHNHCNDLKPFEPFDDTQLGDLFPYWVAVVQSRLASLFQEVKASAPKATIIALDYPLVVSGNECPAAEVPGFRRSKLSTEEQQWMREANRMLNRAVQRAAAFVGIHFVSVEDRFEGHAVCGASDDWIFGTRHFWPQGLFHPTARGQHEYARAINSYLESLKSHWSGGYFATGLPRNPEPQSRMIDSMGLESKNLPNFGKLSIELMSAPNCKVGANLVAPNQPVRISGRGFAANREVLLSVTANDQIFRLGTATSSSTGELDTTLNLPDTLPITDVAVFEASGAGSSGGGLLLIEQLKVVSTLTLDEDEDGIPDGCDNCPMLANWDQEDSDHDDVGDGCDVCPMESINDEDGDSVCAPLDICPLDSQDDIDHDGVCANEDNCSSVNNHEQEDVDGNGVGDKCQALKCYSIDVFANPVKGGEIQMSSGGCSIGGYFSGEAVRIVAVPEPGYSFAGWIFSDSNAFKQKVPSNPELNIVASSNLEISAQFQRE